MANIVYTKFLEQLALGAVNWETAVIRALLERDTSSYTANKDHNFVSDLTGLVEITAGGYARANIPGKQVSKVDASDRIELDATSIAFGNIASGQTVKSMIVYVQTGGDDTTPTDDSLVTYIDTDAGGQLPKPTGGGAFNVVPAASGLIQAFQP